jgi:predicted acetyltransferase
MRRQTGIMAADQLELRPVDAGEVVAFVRAVDAAFGNVPTDEDLAYFTALTVPDQTLAVFDGGRIVATAGWNAFELTLPAAAGSAYPVISVPGVTAVGVHPTHRRQGLLNRMMTRQLDDLRRRGELLAILTASESVIYGRYGYGLAQSFQEVAVASRRAAFRRPVVTGGHMRLADPDEAGKILPDLHDRARRLRPGEISRPPQWWEWQFRDPEKDRDGGGARFYAVHESDRGEPDGYTSYRYHHSWPDGLPSSRVAVRDVTALTPDVYAALWRFLLDLDLVGEVTCHSRPLDETLRWLLAEPRQLRTTGIGDHIWARIIDVPGALAARGYGTEEQLVLDVQWPDPDSAGRFALTTGPDAGHCRKARRSDKTDLVLGLADLGAVYLGAVGLSVLARAGRVVEERPGALARADAAFASPVAPFCGTGF